jgi:hypothetical protein
MSVTSYILFFIQFKKQEYIYYKWKKNLSKSSSKSFGRPVLQKDLNGNIIKEWETGKLASQVLNLSYTAINNCCRNNNKNIIRQRDKNKLGKYTSFNYIWEYKK